MRYTKTILLLTRIATVIYFVILAVNLIVPVLDGNKLNLNFFTVLILICWTFTILSANGFFKKMISNVDGEIVYDTFVPIMPATLIRVAEIGWFVFKHKGSVNFGVFGIDVFLDIIFIVVLLADKSNYYYMSVEDNEDD